MSYPLPPRIVAATAVVLMLAGASCGGGDTTTDSAQNRATTEAVAAATVAVVSETEATAADPTDTAADAEPEPADTDTSPAATEADPDPDPDPDSMVGYTGSYSLIDDDFDTMVTVTVAAGTRTIESNALPDHATGDFPNRGNPNTISAQSLTNVYPTDPVYVGNAGFAQMPGVAVNGVPFEPGTAETVTCDSGETYRIEGLQDLYDLGMDFNNAHVQPTGKYHYHGIAELLVAKYGTGSDLVHVGFAADGFLMYYSLSGAYESSYRLSTNARQGSGCTASGPAGGTAVEMQGSVPDGTYDTDWNYVEGAGDLDNCNGVTIDGEYAYLFTDEYPFISRCLNGEFTATGPGGQGPGGAGSDQAGQGLDLSAAAASLGVSVEELMDALGAPPPDLEAAAATLGIPVAELQAVLPGPGGG